MPPHLTVVRKDLIPGKRPDKILHYDSRCYSGQFSEDGNFFFCCSQDFRVRLYDTLNPYEWKYYKAVSFPFGQWTITDATLSPDNKYLAFSSMHHEAALAPTDPNDSSEPILLDFGNSSQPRTLLLSRHFGVCSTYLLWYDHAKLTLSHLRSSLYGFPAMAVR